MEQINNDLYYEKTKSFIQQHINDQFLDSILRQKMIDCYQQLTTDNAKDFYNYIHNLYFQEINKNINLFNRTCFKYSAIIFVSGSVIASIGAIGKYFSSKTSRINKYSQLIQNFGFISIFVGTLMVFLCWTLNF